jgi:hypothetical protein
VPLIPTRVSATGQILSFALLVGALAATPMAPVDAQKAKPIPNPTANLTFAEGLAVASDGNGTYFNGVDGVEATVFMSPSYSNSGDLVVQFGSSRHVNVTLQNPFARDTTEPVAGPTGTFAADTMFVQAIGFVPVGTTEARIARFASIAGLPDHVVGFRASTNTEPETFINGTPVCVDRSTASTWTIFTTPTGECVGGGQTGAVFTRTSRKGKTVDTFVARYQIPFSISVQLQ